MDRSSTFRAVAIAAVAGIVLLGFGVTPARAQAVHVFVPNDWMILAPLEPDTAIFAPVSAYYVITPSPMGVIPQGGDWSLDWTGGGGLPPGYYEGRVNCNVYVVSFQEDPPQLSAWAECVVRSPGVGVIVQNPIQITSNNFCLPETVGQPFRMEWNMHIRATGVYAGLSGDGVVVIEGIC